MSTRLVALIVALHCVACGGGSLGGDPVPDDPVPVIRGAPLVLAAGMVTLEPEPVDRVSAGVDVARLGVAQIDAVYEATTPAGEPFVFDIFSSTESNRGDIRVSIAHALDGNAPASGGPESMAAAGVVPSASGAVSRSVWLDAHGDGFARITVRGEIDRDQVFAVQKLSDEGSETALVRIRIGPPSEINPDVVGGGDYPGILDETTIYSSNSWRFGLPTAAVSGDRTSIVCYEGDRADPRAWQRYEIRLQHDHATGSTTGGGEEEPSLDAGNWRDHEIAALFNVLAHVHSGTQLVTLKISFDRGATFQQIERFGQGVGSHNRLVQIAMAADYTLAVIFWQTDAVGTELVLVEGHPVSFDAGGSPTGYDFDAPVTIHRDLLGTTPVLMGMTYSEGGDLVIGYGFTRFERFPDATWKFTTQFRNAVRLYQQPLEDTLVEESVVVGRDPSVSVLGSGETMSIFYAHESESGIRLRSSTDAGRTFSPPVTVGGRSAHLPTVFAREQGGKTIVDLLYLVEADEGRELHLRHWDDYGATPPEDYHLTRAMRVESASAPITDPVPGASAGVMPPQQGYRITQIGWFGYDAVLNGDGIVVVYDEETYDAAVFFMDFAVGAPDFGAGSPSSNESAPFRPADPPPLAPGLTEPVPSPDDDHMHQLRVMRLR